MICPRDELANSCSSQCPEEPFCFVYTYATSSFAGNIEETKSASSLKIVEFNTSGTTFEKEDCSPTTSKTDACKDFQQNQDGCYSTHSLDNNNNETGTECPDDVERHPPDAHMPSMKTLGFSNFPKCGQFFVGAIKKNRSCQKLLRSKLIQIEARIEELKELKKRVQTLKDFQVSCRKRTERALSQMKKDPRIQLITQDTYRKSKVMLTWCFIFFYPNLIFQFGNRNLEFLRKISPINLKLCNWMHN